MHSRGPDAKLVGQRIRSSSQTYQRNPYAHLCKRSTVIASLGLFLSVLACERAWCLAWRVRARSLQALPPACSSCLPLKISPSSTPGFVWAPAVHLQGVRARVAGPRGARALPSRLPQRAPGARTPRRHLQAHPGGLQEATQLPVLRRAELHRQVRRAARRTPGRHTLLALSARLGSFALGAAVPAWPGGSQRAVLGIRWPPACLVPCAQDCLHHRSVPLL